MEKTHSSDCGEEEVLILVQDDNVDDVRQFRLDKVYLGLADEYSRRLPGPVDCPHSAHAFRKRQDITSTLSVYTIYLHDVAQESMASFESRQLNHLGLSMGSA
jgi:hypothetical protein